MDVAKLAQDVEMAGMELRGYLTRLEQMAKEVETYARKCEQAVERCGQSDAEQKKLSHWEEAVELLNEAVAEFPALLQSLEDVLSGVENAPTALGAIAQANAAEAIAKHDKKLAERSAFNRR